MSTIVYDGYDFSRDFVIGTPSRPLPEFKVSSTETDGIPGASFDGVTHGVRECSFTLTARKSGTELQRAARELFAVLSVDSPRELAFGDEKDANRTQLVRFAAPSGSFDFEEFANAGTFELRFQQPDPYLYGRERSIELPRSQAVTFETGGNVTAYPLIESTPRADYPMWEAVLYDSLDSSHGSGWAGQVLYDSRYLDGSGQAFGGTNRLHCSLGDQSVWFDRLASDWGRPVRGLATVTRFFGIEGTVRMRSTYTDSVATWRERWL